MWFYDFHESLFQFVAYRVKDKDIADDITCDHIRNYTLNHLVERIKVYNEENFNYEFNSIRLK